MGDFIIKSKEPFTFRVTETGKRHELRVINELEGADIDRLEIYKITDGTPLAEQERITKQFFLNYVPELEEELKKEGIGNLIYIKLFEAYFHFCGDAAGK